MHLLTPEQINDAFAEGVEAAYCGLFMKDGPRAHNGRRTEAWRAGYRQAMRQRSCERCHGTGRIPELCFSKMGWPNTECWCWNARPDGSHIPCQEASNPMPIDMLGRAADKPTATAIHDKPTAAIEDDLGWYCCG